jgi:hypothetical protein
MVGLYSAHYPVSAAGDIAFHFDHASAELTWQSSQLARERSPSICPKEEWRLFAAPVTGRIHLRIIVWIFDLNFVRSYPDDRAVLFMQLGSLPQKTSRMRPQIIVRLVPFSDRCELRAWYMRDGVKVDSIAGQCCGICERRHCNEQQECHFVPTRGRYLVAQ